MDRSNTSTLLLRCLKICRMIMRHKLNTKYLVAFQRTNARADHSWELFVASMTLRRTSLGSIFDKGNITERTSLELL